MHCRSPPDLRTAGTPSVLPGNEDGWHSARDTRAPYRAPLAPPDPPEDAAARIPLRPPGPDKQDSNGHWETARLRRLNWRRPAVPSDNEQAPRCPIPRPAVPVLCPVCERASQTYRKGNYFIHHRTRSKIARRRRPLAALTLSTNPTLPSRCARKSA